jgi:hypothetical protein
MKVGDTRCDLTTRRPGRHQQDMVLSLHARPRRVRHPRAHMEDHVKGSRQYGLEGVNRPAQKFKLFLQKNCQGPEPPRLFPEPPNEAASENKLRTFENC